MNLKQIEQDMENVVAPMAPDGQPVMVYVNRNHCGDNVLGQVIIVVGTQEWVKALGHYKAAMKCKSLRERLIENLPYSERSKVDVVHWQYFWDCWGGRCRINE
jgi:hypothetical protein